MQTNKTYQEALAAAREGYLISREEWKDKGLHVFVQVPSEVPAEIIPRMSSLPNSVKTLLVQRGGPIRYYNQIVILTEDNQISTWVCSPRDSEATDWIIHMEPQGDFTAAPVAETAGTAKPV